MYGRLKSESIEWLENIILAVIIAIAIKTFILSSAQVNGNSMYPTLYEKDRLFTFKLPLYYRGPNRYDLVVFSAPDDKNKDYIKRVIGLPKDKVEILKGSVYVNGNLLREDYLEDGLYTQTFLETSWDVGEDEIFVLGDNRSFGASKDSRYFGMVKMDSIKGIANIRYYPFGRKLGNINK